LQAGRRRIVPPEPTGETTSADPTYHATNQSARSEPSARPSLAFRGAMSSSHINPVTDDTFEPEVLNSDLPVLVDYWAEWCGPCKSIAPILDEVAQEYDGRLKVAKMNVDENQQVPAKFGIRGIPTLMLFKNGNLEATKVGALSKSQLTAFLDSNI
jgi:thioredoxin 1